MQYFKDVRAADRKMVNRIRCVKRHSMPSFRNSAEVWRMGGSAFPGL